jgi:hypothetical protein
MYRVWVETKLHPNDASYQVIADSVALSSSERP